MKTFILSTFGLLLGSLLFGQSPTFSEDIAPIIYNKCTYCHRPGEIGPMPFTNYTEVANWAGMIQYVTETGYMPPWQPDPNYSSLLGENYLDSSEIRLIRDWVVAGLPQGDPAQEPPLPQFPSGSLLGQPDLVLSFAEAYRHIGNNEDEYRIFVLPTGLTEDKEIAAVEFRPGNKRIVHHALVAADTSGLARINDLLDPAYGYSSFGGFGVSGANNNQFPGYVPGQVPRMYPEGIGKRLYAGSDLLLQVHYAPVAADEWDSSHVNIFFKKEPIQREVQNYIMLPLGGTLTNGPFFIPPNAVKTFHGVWTVPQTISLIGMSPHMHLLGRSWEIVAIQPNGDSVALIKIPDWDFNWQGSYQFDRLIKLEAGAEVHAYATYDNTVNNPLNPNNPPQLVTWGEKTSDEMYYLPLSFVDYRPGDENIILSDENLGALFSFPKNQILALYPNPARNQAKLEFSLAAMAEVHLRMFDLQGKQLRELPLGRYPMGEHTYSVELDGLAKGAYLLQLQAGEQQVVKKLVVE